LKHSFHRHFPKAWLTSLRQGANDMEDSKEGAIFAISGSPAQVAELVDAQASGACGRKVVEVRVFFWAPKF
jgi:hypothetical protein